MPFVHEVEVLEADIDNLGHASNLVYLRWVQDAALAHSTALGFSEQAYIARGEAWVVRRHEIEYLRAAVLRDRLRIETHVESMKVANSVRRTEIFRGTELLCRAATDWVYVDLARGRPTRIPQDVRSVFPLEPQNAPT
jgi:acyl-CoA thioester hydrolase